MSVISLIFLLLFIYFVVRPLVKVWLAVRRARGGDLSGFAEFFGGSSAASSARGRRRAAGGGREASQERRRSGWSGRYPAKKKIDPNVGEYVSFTEVKSSTSQQTTYTDGGGGGTSSTSFEREEQVTDVEWEDIKP